MGYFRRKVEKCRKILVMFLKFSREGVTKFPEIIRDSTNIYTKEAKKSGN